jgi:DNA invertase Pin-like site-specific DNA recombinase
MKRFALYARVSTIHHGQDVEVQLSELREYAQHRGWMIAGEYADRGVSGSKDRRPELDKLMAAAHQRKIDGILVWQLSRFGRSLKHLVNALAELEALGVSFVSVRDNLDLSTPGGRLMFQIIGAMAEFEKALTVERVRAGLAYARSKGTKLGRPAQTLPVARIAKLREQGLSWRAVGKEIGLSPATCLKATTNKSPFKG